MKKFKFKKIKAFGIAEILIIIVVISVLSVMAGKTYFKNSNTAKTKKEAIYINSRTSVLKLMSVYNNLKQFGEAAKINNSGTISNLYSNSDELMEAFCDNFQCIGSSKAQAPSYWTKQWHNLNGDKGWKDFSQFASASLLDGSLAVFEITSPQCLSSSYRTNGTYTGCGFIHVDVNATKPPNIAGRDIFSFHITRDGIFPVGDMNSDYNNTLNFCNPQSKLSRLNGIGCTFKVITENTITY